MSEIHRQDLPAGWVSTTLDAVQLDLGGNVDPSHTPDETFELYSVPSHELGIPVIVKGSEIGSNKQTVEHGTVLLCKINPRINRVWVTGNHSTHRKIASTEWIPFFSLPSIEPRFLAYFLRQNPVRDFLAQNASGVGGSLMRVRAATFRDYLFPLAPRREQTRIADTLDELLSDLDAGVAALERARAKLAHYRAAVLKTAVEGTLTADWRAQHPATEPASSLLTRILAERRNRWEEDQLRRFKEAGKTPPKNWKAKYKEPVAPDTAKLPTLPDGWCWATVEQIGDVGTGATPNKGNKSRYYENGNIPWVTSACVNHTFVREVSGYVTTQALDECNLTVYPPGTILLAMYGEGKTRGMSAELAISAATNQALAGIQTTHEIKDYLKLFLSKHYQDLRRIAIGGVQPNLSLSIVRSIALPCPPVAEQEAIVEAVEDQLSVIEHLEAGIEAKLKSAQSLRQSILRHAFTGKLVPQDPDDEPAAALLTRIAAERETRARQAKVGKRPGTKPKSPRKRAAESE